MCKKTIFGLAKQEGFLYNSLNSWKAENGYERKFA